MIDKRHFLGFSLVTFIEETTHQKKHESTSWIFLCTISRHSYRGTVPEPGAGLTAAPAACAGWSYSATAGSPACRRTARGRTPARRV